MYFVRGKFINMGADRGGRPKDATVPSAPGKFLEEKLQNRGNERLQKKIKLSF
jgi:hypothetical protein